MHKKFYSLLLATGILISPLAIATPVNNSSSPVNSLSGLPDFSTIYETVGKSVVNISVTQNIPQQNVPMLGSGDPMFDFFFRRMLPPQQRQYKQRGLGSGFIISNNGYILTNAHVVNNADSVMVKLSDKREFKAKIIGVDLTSDIAVIKIEAKSLPTVKFGNPNIMKPGNWVVAIGSPFGLDNTITQGIISALSRNLPDDSSVPYIQSDVPINPGNSGGPLINLRGEVIGINSQIYSKSGGYMGISFSIPIDYATKIAEQLKATGKVVHGRLGIAIQPLTDDLASSFGLSGSKGALVNQVEANSAAAKAGIQVGDIILKINGQDVIDTAMLPQLVSNLGPNKTVNLQIWRNNRLLNLNATTMAASNNDNNQNSSTTDGVNKEITKLGIVVSQLTPKQIQQLGVKLSSGLVIQSANNDAQFAGISQGDIIIGIANNPITSLDQFIRLVNHYRNGQTIALKILRMDGNQAITLFIPLVVQNNK